MQRFRAWVAAGLMAANLGLGTSALAEEPIEAATPGLQAAAYDVIIVPRPGNGSPRVLTERGWRSLASRSPRTRLELAPFRSRQTWSGQSWNGQTWNRQPRSGQNWNSQSWVSPYSVRPYAPRPYASRDGASDPRWTGYDGYRRPGYQRAY